MRCYTIEQINEMAKGSKDPGRFIGDYLQDIQEVRDDGDTVCLSKSRLKALHAIWQTGRRPPGAAWTAAAKKIGHGVGGIIKNAVGADQAAQSVIEARREICYACEELKPCREGSKKMCCGKRLDVLKPGKRTCGCGIEAKIRLAGEQCPLEKPKW